MQRVEMADPAAAAVNIRVSFLRAVLVHQVKETTVAQVKAVLEFTAAVVAAVRVRLVVIIHQRAAVQVVSAAAEGSGWEAEAGSGSAVEAKAAAAGWGWEAGAGSDSVAEAVGLSLAAEAASLGSARAEVEARLPQCTRR